MTSALDRLGFPPDPWRSYWCSPGRYGEERPLPHQCYDEECECPCHAGACVPEAGHRVSPHRASGVPHTGRRQAEPALRPGLGRTSGPEVAHD